MKSNSVEIITKSFLCCGCGICTKICPQQAISLKRNVAGFIISSVDTQKCVNCGKCLRVCPKEEVYQICNGNKELSSPEMEIKNICQKVINSYICYSTDKSIRENGQSGGVITSVLKYMLDNALIDKAYINKFEPKLNTNQMVKASSLNDLMEGIGSFYSQSSTEECIGKNNSAAVVLGCQATAIRRFEKVNPFVPIYLIGLFCGGNFSQKYYERIESNHKNKDIERFRFRDKRYGGWPGNVSFKSGGKTIVIDKSFRMREKETYLCASCDYCKERINTNADFAVGDPWGIHDFKIEEGYSVVLTYTDKGDDIIRNALKSGYLMGEEIPYENIINGQDVTLEFFNKYNKHIKKECEKSEIIRLHLRKRIYGSTNKLCYHTNILTFRIYEKLINFIRKVRRR